MARSQTRLMLVTVTALLVTTMVYLNSNKSMKANLQKDPLDEALFTKYRKCIWNGLTGKDADTIWKISHNVVGNCEAKMKRISERLPLIKMTNDDESKFALDVFPMIKQEEECNVVTLGIGMDIKAEQQLKGHLSTSCHFHGADPGEADNKELYSKIGTFYPYAVAAKSGVQRAFIYEPKNKTYNYQNITHLDIVTFLKEKAKVKIIDYLWMDNEYAEYDLVKFFLPGELMDQNGITVCQWNCEFHINGNTTKYKDFFLKNLESGRFLPVNFSVNTHIRAVFINVQDEVCLRRYIYPGLSDQH